MSVAMRPRPPSPGVWQSSSASMYLKKQKPTAKTLKRDRKSLSQSLNRSESSGASRKASCIADTESSALSRVSSSIHSSPGLDFRRNPSSRDFAAEPQNREFREIGVSLA